MKTYNLSLTKDYVSGWGFNEAVRELLQNAIDSPAEMEVYHTADGVLRITSKNASLDKKTLLLGKTSKGDNESIGKFGEGYKLALLVLTRLGHTVIVEQENYDWYPRFAYDDDFEQEILTIEEREISNPPDICFAICDVSSAQYQTVIDNCLQLQPPLQNVIETSYGQIIKDTGGKMLYVNGLFVCKTDLDYSYNIKPKHLKLERDRQTVNSFDLKWITKEMWLEAGETDVELEEHTADMIYNGVEDIEHVQHVTPRAALSNRVYEKFNADYPGAAVAENQKSADEMRKKGYANVVVFPRAMAQMVTRSPHYAPRTIKIDQPAEVLEDWYYKNSKHLKPRGQAAFRKLILQSASWSA